MTITQCDICKATLEARAPAVHAGFGLFGGNTFCLPCGKPILLFLKKHELLPEDFIIRKSQKP